MARDDNPYVIRPRAGSTPQPLGSTLSRFFEQMGGPATSTVTDLAEAWGEIVGPALDGPTRPAGLLDGVLTVACDDASWAAQVGWMDGQIKQRFAQRFPDEELRRVRTRVAR
ncbi:MAG: DUF721 domain-containing protein [Acidimicrobiales bacterium]